MTDNLPQTIWAYLQDHGTGTWIDFDDSCRISGDIATQYTKTEDIREVLKPIMVNPAIDEETLEKIREILDGVEKN